MNTQAQAKERLFGFDVVSPRDIMEPGGFANAPTNPQTAIIVQKSVLTALSYDHHVWEGLDHVHVWGHNQLRKQTETQLHFHWEVLREIQTEAVPVELTLEFDHGLETTDTSRTSMATTLGAEGGGSAKGLSLSLSASVTQSHEEEHSVAITDHHHETWNFTCPPGTTLQVWQLIATFNYKETLPPWNPGYSMDSIVPPYYPSPVELVIPTKRVVFRTFPVNAAIEVSGSSDD